MSEHKKTIEERIYEIAANHAEVSIDDIDDETYLLDDLGLDSLDAIEFITSIEEEFELEISDLDMEKLECIGDVIQFVRKNVDELDKDYSEDKEKEREENDDETESES